MKPMRGPLLSPCTKTSRGELEAIGSAEHERSMMLELASTLEEWPARNIVVRRRLDHVAREIVRLASVQPDLASARGPSAARPRATNATTSG
jgi:hypothetical protein